MGNFRKGEHYMKVENLFLQIVVFTIGLIDIASNFVENLIVSCLHIDKAIRSIRF